MRSDDSSCIASGRHRTPPGDAAADGPGLLFRYRCVRSRAAPRRWSGASLPGRPRRRQVSTRSTWPGTTMRLQSEAVVRGGRQELRGVAGWPVGHHIRSLRRAHEHRPRPRERRGGPGAIAHGDEHRLVPRCRPGREHLREHGGLAGGRRPVRARWNPGRTARELPAGSRT